MWRVYQKRTQTNDIWFHYCRWVHLDNNRRKEKKIERNEHPFCIIIYRKIRAISCSQHNFCFNSIFSCTFSVCVCVCEFFLHTFRSIVSIQPLYKNVRVSVKLFFHQNDFAVNTNCKDSLYKFLLLRWFYWIINSTTSKFPNKCFFFTWIYMTSITSTIDVSFLLFSFDGNINVRQIRSIFKWIQKCSLR